MHWADKIAKEIIASGKYKPYWVDDMKTPSGFATIGSLRGPLIHSLIYRALKDAGEKVTFTFVINDFDPIDSLPQELRRDFSKYMGFPLRTAPSPKEGYGSYAEYFAADFKKNFEDLGVEARLLFSWEIYHQGEFDEAIRIALDNAEKIQDIYQKVSGSKKKEKGWLPFQVVCEKCGKIGTTKVYAWNGKEVSYRCEEHLVKWASGCGYEGKISPFGGTGKLPWKVDWPAHWKVIGITIEGAGKDHASAGGSYDIAMALCDEVFKNAKPFKLPYEFFLIGGKKMSSSKGLGLKAHDVVKILPPEVGRFIFVKTDYREQIEFNPVETVAIPDLFDEYDRCWKAYIEKSDEDLAQTFELSQVGKVPEKKEVFLPRFRDIANYLQQPNIDLEKKFAELKGNSLNKEELEILKEREKYAKIWLERYAPKSEIINFSDEVPKEARALSPIQKEYLAKVLGLIQKESNAEDLQAKLYKLTKELGIITKDAFAAIYISTIGQPSGPKAAWFLLSLPKNKIIERLREVIKK
jgi:lysyl-tRNA synthetase class 1